MSPHCCQHACRCIVVREQPKNGRPWEYDKAYFEPGAAVLVCTMYDAKRPGTVTDIKPSRRFARVNYRVRHHDGTTDDYLLEDLTGHWALDGETRRKLQGPGYFALPRGHSWPGLRPGKRRKK